MSIFIRGASGWRTSGEEDRCLHVALPVAAFCEMLTKSVTTRANTATRAGCVLRGMGHPRWMCFAWDGSFLLP